LLALPLAPFLLIGDASLPQKLEPTDEAPIVFRIVEEDAGKSGAEFEICFEKVEFVDFAESDHWGQIALNISLNEYGALELAKATIPNVGAQADLIFEGEVIVSPIIQEPLLGGNFQITGIETIARAEQIRQAVLGRCTDLKAEIP